MRTALPISTNYRSAIFDALVVQLLVALFAVMLLDDGRFAHTTGIAVLAFWAGATLIILRRPLSPTPTDLSLIRYGILPLLFLTYSLAEWIWSWHWVWTIRGITPPR